MKYNWTLDMLESKGIDYHRLVSNFILENFCKNYTPNSASVLVYGDKDLLISYLLSEKFIIHLTNYGFKEPTNTHRIKTVELGAFPLAEYDLIVGLFCDKNFIQNCIGYSNNFFIIPEYNYEIDLNEFTRNHFKTNNISFNEKYFNSFMCNRTAFFNFHSLKISTTN